MKPGGPIATDHGDHATSSHTAPLIQFRFTVLAVLCVTEVWLLRKRFTTDELIGSGGWLVPLVRFTRFAVPWGLCVVAALLVIGGGRLRDLVRELAASSAVYRGWPQALAHPLALVAFFGLTSQLLREGSTHAQSWIWVSSWIASGVLVLFSLALVAFPLQEIGRFAWRTSWMFTASLVVGTFALVALSYLGETWPLVGPLGQATLWFSHKLLALFSDEIVFRPQELVLGAAGFEVIITKYCSGYEGMSLFLVFFVVFLILWRHRLRFPNTLLLVPLGMTAVWMMNSIRIVILVLLGAKVSPAIALDGFHVNAGWPSICFVSFGIVILGTRFGFFASRPVELSAPHEVNPTAAYLAPLLVIVATSMVAGAFTATPESMYPVKILGGAAALWIFRKELDLRFGWSWMAGLIGVAACAIWIALHYVLGPGDEDPIAWQDSRSPVFLIPWWVFRILGSVAIVPLAEELAFRGYLLRRLVSPDFESARYGKFRWVPFLLSSLVFGALHQAWVAGTVVGLLYALAAYRRGRLFDAVVAHAVTNGLLAVFAATTGNWGIL